MGPDHPGITEMMHAERRTNELLPSTVPAPALRWSLGVKGWSVLGFESVAGRHPQLHPSSSDVAQVMGVLETLSATQCPAGLPDAPSRFTGWRDCGAWAERGGELVWWEERCSMAGDTLVHADLRADNMLLAAGGRVLVVDWAAAVRGAAWVDPAYVCAQLVMSGWEPAAAEQLLGVLPAWKEADPEQITAFAVGLCGIWERGAAREQPPGLREYRSRAAVAGRAWISYRLGWS
ncbi:phosphotransferase [Streptomyces sp. NPDC054855]